MASLRRPGPQVPAWPRRAGTFAATSAVLASIGHWAGGGSLPNVWLLLVGAAALAGLSYPLLRREATWPQIVAALAVAQGLLHAWLMVAGAHHGSHPSHGLTASMLLAHGAATAAAAVWLRYGEQRLWSAARAAWVRLILQRRRWLADPAIPSVPEVPAAGWFPPALAAEYSPAALGVRGPPLPVGP